MTLTKKFTFVLLVLVLAPFARAEIAAENLPSMDNLAALLANVDKSAVNKSIRSNSGPISVGLPTTDSARGTTADEIASLLSGGNEVQKNHIKDAIMEERTAFENVLVQNNFAMNDFGVAYAVSFIVLWEMASRKELPLDGSIETAKFLVQVFQGVDRQRYNAMSDRRKDEGYDWLMTTPIAFGSLIKGFQKEGKTQAADQLRDKCASLFLDVFKLPYNFITISDQGDVGVNVDKIMEYNEKQGGSSNNPRS